MNYDDNLYVVVVGNPFDGLNVFGPFTYDEAVDWEVRDDDYWIVKVSPPDQNTTK